MPVGSSRRSQFKRRLGWRSCSQKEVNLDGEYDGRELGPSGPGGGL